MKPIRLSRSEGLRLYYGRTDVIGIYPGWGLGAWVEFPTGSRRAGQIYFNLIWGEVFIQFPWYRAYGSASQISGPRFGFRFLDTDLSFRVMYGINDGSRKGSHNKVIEGIFPWRYEKLCRIAIEGEPLYTYICENGQIQVSKTRLSIEKKWWGQRWLPFKRCMRTLRCEFNTPLDGTHQATIDMFNDESYLDAFIRIQKVRRFA